MTGTNNPARLPSGGGDEGGNFRRSVLGLLAIRTGAAEAMLLRLVPFLPPGALRTLPWEQLSILRASASEPGCSQGHYFTEAPNKGKGTGPGGGAKRPRAGGHRDSIRGPMGPESIMTLGKPVVQCISFQISYRHIDSEETSCFPPVLSLRCPLRAGHHGLGP